MASCRPRGVWQDCFVSVPSKHVDAVCAPCLLVSLSSLLSGFFFFFFVLAFPFLAPSTSSPSLFHTSLNSVTLRTCTAAATTATCYQLNGCRGVSALAMEMAKPMQATSHRRPGKELTDF